MYQSPVALDYTAAYHQDEISRYVHERELESQVDHHSGMQHQLIAAVVALILILAVLAAI